MGNNTAYSLKPEVIYDIEARTSLTSEQIRRLFRDYSLLAKKKSWSRSISIENLTALYDVTFQGDSQNFVRRLFHVMDVDRNGEIDFQEFVTSFVQLNGAEHQKLVWLFSLYDVDHRGHIYHDDLRAVVQAVLDLLNNNMFGERNTADTLSTDILKSVDKNLDNRISLAEFIEGATACATLWRLLEVITDAAQKPFSVGKGPQQQLWRRRGQTSHGPLDRNLEERRLRTKTV